MEKLVVELVDLPVSVIGQLPVSAGVKDLAKEVRDLKGGARRRQVKYITKLLRREAVDDVYAFLSSRKGDELLRKKQFHEIEYLRDSLVEEAIVARRTAKAEQRELEESWPSRVIEEIRSALPAVDATGIGRLACLFARTRNRKHSREIFRILQAAREQEELKRKQNA